jgi:hypothetical protein
VVDIDHPRTKTKSPRFHIAKGVSFIRFMSTSNSSLSQIEMTTIVFSAHTRRACPSFSIILREVGVPGFTMPSLFRFLTLTRFGRERGPWDIRTICGFE